MSKEKLIRGPAMIECLDDMIKSEGYQNYASDTVYSLQHHCIHPRKYNTSPETMEAHQIDGMFGVMHDDVINNMKEYLDSHYREITGECECIDESDSECEMCNLYKKIVHEIDDLENWHIDHGSIGDII
jgi:hypothetical protein